MSPPLEKKQADGALARVASALVLAPLAIIVVLLGGWPFVLVWCLAAMIVYWEWTAEIVKAPRSAEVAGVGVLAVAGLLGASGFPGMAILVIAVGAGALAALGGTRRLWCGAGLLYAGLVLAGPMLLRRDLHPDFGVLALFYLFAVVWATDILALFAGRRIGGPKLAPSISPKKTWSGAIAGALGGVAAGAAVAAVGSNLLNLPKTNILAATGLALLLSVVAQGGDLFESAVKRRFGVKDSGRIIPGHGGLMDRLDGFLAAAGAAALLGVARGGLDGAASGLLAW
ncbi:MAG: CDP-archaeol synthase [Bradyrhizobiaceae bacterium]|nr:CDP-archaeol synthase [Bradyrhizobiaceae bacterium]